MKGERSGKALNLEKGIVDYTFQRIHGPAECSGFLKKG
jgi:hypothetical protein